MCGRYNITDDLFIQELMLELGLDIKLKPAYNIAPTDNIPVITANGSDAKKLSMRKMRWWLTPSWAPEINQRYNMFNAKSETVLTSKAFKGPFLHRRAVVPASGFIEWRKENGVRTPYYFKFKNQAMLFAALWEPWQQGSEYSESCAILTTDATPQMLEYHDRMPALIQPDQLTRWLNPETDLPHLIELLNHPHLNDMDISALSSAINNSRIKDDRAIKPIEYHTGSNRELF
ncbi:MAG: SOS response-associated peptidase [Pseudomonadales bacterium]|nr:SOS response-associated peptidase [Pseudomonadales bacterium]